MRIKVKLKVQDSKVYSGEEVANYMQNITPSKENIPTYYANIAKKHNFKLIKIPTNELIDKYIGNDVGAMEYIEGSADRYTGSDFNGFYDQDYNQIDISEEDLYNPIVIVNGELLDGYSRVKQHLKRNIDHIMAYVNIKGN
jgi:disulfide oxidoreductase YuzD